MFIITENGQYRGEISFVSILLPDACISNDHISSAAEIAASKLEHQHRQIYSQDSDTTAAAERRVVHVVSGVAGTLQSFAAGCVVANVSDATVIVDLHKNGVSVLDAAISINSADAARAVVAGTITSTAVAADDVLEVVVSVAAGGGTLGKGVFASLDLFEDVS
jgi:hypothetical protein